MRLKICVNPNVEITEKQLLYLADFSGKDSEIIHFGRNRIKLIKSQPAWITVKRFSQSLKNKIIYSFVRSKARKSYENALTILSRCINTPLPYGYIENRNWAGILLQSKYICEYHYSMTLYEAVLKYGRECLGAFAVFVARLHDNGIRHDDLNNSNVRVNVDEQNNFSFSLIDLNRMKIYKAGKEVPEKECFKNICRFSTLDSDYIYFVIKYIETRNMTSEKLKSAVNCKKNHDKKVDAKKWFKKLITLQYI